MTCTNVSVYNGPVSVPTLLALRAQPYRQLVGGEVLVTAGALAVGDGSGSSYTWDPASLAEDDNETVVRPDLLPAASSGRWVAVGAANPRYTAPGLGAAARRTYTAKMADRFDARDVSGFDPSGNNSSAAALQTAVNLAMAQGAPLHVPTGTIVLDSTILITKPLEILGSGASVGAAVSGYTAGKVLGPATRLHLAHSGVGFQMGDPAAPQHFDGVVFRDLMTTRPQPEPVTGQAWTPGDFDFDFNMFAMSGLYLDHVTGLNPTRFVRAQGGGGIGRIFLNDVAAQPMVCGVRVDLAADVVRGSNLHFWPFWKDNLEVGRWTTNNCDHLYLMRCDTPLFTNFFSIASRSAVRFGSNSFGGTSKFKMSNYDVDYSAKCVWFDNTAQNTWARFTNGSLQANNAGLGSAANIPTSLPRSNVSMEGVNCYAMFNGIEMAGSSGSAVKMTGTYNHLEVNGDFWLQEYGNANPALEPGVTAPNTEPGILVNATNNFATTATIRNTSPGPGPLMGGAGRYKGVRRRYAPSVAPQSGANTDVSLSAADCHYMEAGSVVHGNAVVVVGASGAGNAAGYARVSLPTACDYTFTASAMDITTNTPLLAVSIVGEPAYLQITRADGGNVLRNGATVAVSYTYTRSN